MIDHSMAVKEMFSKIAVRYDRLNRIMTFGMDTILKHEVVHKLKPEPGQIILDDGAGTGDLSFDILSYSPLTKVIAVDFTRNMLEHAQKRDKYGQVQWILADAQALPFKAHSFHGVVSGYLLRNVSSINSALTEQIRVLKPGGRSVILDTSPPAQNILRPFILFYLRTIIPLFGKFFAGNSTAYTYLPQTTEHFLNAVQLGEQMDQAGFSSVRWVHHLFGCIAIHQAEYH